MMKDSTCHSTGETICCNVTVENDSYTYKSKYFKCLVRYHLKWFKWLPIRSYHRHVVVIYWELDWAAECCIADDTHPITLPRGDVINLQDKQYVLFLVSSKKIALCLVLMKIKLNLPFWESSLRQWNFYTRQDLKETISWNAECLKVALKCKAGLGQICTIS